MPGFFLHSGMHYVVLTGTGELTFKGRKRRKAEDEEETNKLV